MAQAMLSAVTARLLLFAQILGMKLKGVNTAVSSKCRYPGLPKSVCAASTPLTTIFRNGIETHGIIHEQIINMAASSPAHFIQRITGVVCIEERKIGISYNTGCRLLCMDMITNSARRGRCR